MKITVTGASGYIGRHVLKALVRKGHRPAAVTRHASRLATWGDLVEVVEMDLARPGDLSILGGPDALIHLAWDGLPNYRSLHHFETELGNQYGFLKGMVQAGLPALVVAGTCLEYGLQEGLLSEDLPAQPTTPYGLAKDTLRRELEFLAAKIPFSLTWARLFYSYGEGQAETSLYASFQACLRRGDFEFRMSGGQQLRDFLPIESLAERLVLAALSGKSLGVVNVCSGKPRSVQNLVEEWVGKSESKPRLNLGCFPYPEYEPMAFWGDSARWNKMMNPADEDAR